MTDSLILASASSPLISTLESDSSIQDFIYSLKSSVPVISRQRVSQSFTAPAFGSTKSVSLNRYGIVFGMYLKIKLTGADATTDRFRNAMISAIEEAVISSNNRNIEVLTGACNLHRILSMNTGPKDQILDLAQAGALNNDATIDDKDYLIPLKFSFFESKSTLLPVEFLENLECFVKFGASSDYFGGTLPTISTCDLVVNYYSLSEKNMRQYLQSQYSVERPLSQKLKSCYEESSVAIAAAGSSTISIKSKNVLEYSLLYIKPAGSNSYADIDKIVVNLNGREWYSQTGDELLLEQAMYSGDSNRNQTTEQNLYRIDWGLYDRGNKQNQFRGALSGKGVSSPEIVCTAGATGGTLYCVHVYTNIVSTSGSSGKISISLGL